MYPQTESQSSTRAEREYQRVLSRKAGVGAFMGTVFMWMAAGLGVSAGTATWMATQADLLTTMAEGGLFFWCMLIMPFGLIFVIASRLKNGAGVFEGGFWYLLLTAMMGTWVSGVAAGALEDPAYAGLVGEAFVTTVVMFGGLALTGWITRKDLSGMGNFFLAALWGLIAMGFLNMFVIQSQSVNILHSVIAIVIFAGLTAYDTQKIKQRYLSGHGGHAEAIMGALDLYLDFLNIFIHLLSLLGHGSGSDD